MFIVSTLLMIAVFMMPTHLCRAESVEEKQPVDLGAIIVEATPISKYRVDNVSTATFGNVKPEELPQSVDVLTEDFIDELNPVDLHDLLRYQPGVYTGGKSMMDRTSGQYTLRGMSGSDVMLDGTLGLAGPMGIFMDPTAFDRIEIVKGPVGSTIGGATSTMGPYGAGGSINMVLKQPVLDQNFQHYGLRSAFGDNIQRYRLNYDVNETVVDGKLTMRVPGNFEYGKPFWLSDSRRWRESFFIAPSLLWEMRDDLRLGVSTTFQYTDQPAYQGIPVYKGKPFDEYKWDSNISTSGMRDRYLGHTLQSFVEWDANEIWSLRTGMGFSQADVEFEHLGSSAFASPNYWRLPYDHQEADMLYRVYNAYQRATATFESGVIEHQVVAQVDFSRKISKGRSYFESVSDPNAEHTWVEANYRETELDKYGVLLQDYLTWGCFRVLGGARFDRHESQLNNTGDSFSPHGGLSFLPLDWLVFFGNVSLTESPNFGYLKNSSEELTSSWRATQYETGFRISPIETLWFSTSFYRILQENTAVYDPATTYYYEEGENDSRGVEISLIGNITPNWSIYSAYAYNEYKDRAGGTSFDRYPPHALTVATSYRYTHGGLLDDVVFGFGYRYRHRYSATMRGQYVGDDYYIEGSHVFDCSAEMPLSKFGGPDNMTLSLAVKNIFDQNYIESNRHYYQCFPGTPRTFEVGLQAKF
jgi:iron complex outermembrane recepter protein